MNKLKYLSVIAFCMAVIVVVLGAYTRLVDAGLGCPDWPTCYGHLWVPNTVEEIAAANHVFDETPVETDKTWPEQIHRIFASSLGLVILVMFAIAVLKRAETGPWKTYVFLLSALVAGTVARIALGDIFDLPLLLLGGVYFAYLLYQAVSEGRSSSPFKLLALLAGFVIVQGWFGMWTVTLKLWPQVVTTHLLGGFLTLTLIWLTLQRCFGWSWQLTAEGLNYCRKVKPATWCVLAIVVIQVALGGWTTSNYAALACPDFPTCHAEWWPKGDFSQGFNFFQHVGPNYLGGQLDNYARTAIHLSHRLGAIAVFFGCIFLIFRLWLSGLPPLRKFAFVLGTLLCVQIGLGITNVVGGLPLVVAVAHNAGGAALLLCMATLLQRIHTLNFTQDESA